MPRFCSVDNISDCFSFHTVNYKDTEVKNAHLHTLDKIFKDSLSNPNTVLIISNTSIKNNVATLISYLCSGQNILAKTIHHAINITSTEVKLFSIRYRINQAIQILNTKNIIIITDTIHATRCIFDSSFYPYQLYSIAVSQDLRAFFNKSSNNSLVFWNCPSSMKWLSHSVVGKETKHLNIKLIFPCTWWGFNKKGECNSILQNWEIIFQALDYKENNFLNLINDNNLPTKPTYMKGSTWLKNLEYSNILYIWVIRANINYALIDEYCLRFFSRELFDCSCGVYLIKSRYYILHNCRRYNKY